MDKQAYADYEADFRHGMNNLMGFSSNSWIQECSECPHDATYDDGVCYDVEPYFSWHTCEICGSTLGGNRTDSHAYYVDTLVHLRVCDDCVYYAEYGRLDDETMAALETA